MQPSLTASRTIAVAAAALGLFCACGLGPPAYHPPPPDLVTVSVDTLHFKAAIGQTSEAQHFNIANASPRIVTLKSPWLSPTKNNPFTFQTDCGTELAPNTSCTVTVTFQPISIENKTARLWLNFQNNEEHSVWLNGATVAASK